MIASLPFLGLKTSESVKTSPCIELTSEQGEQDLVPGGRGGASNDWHLLGGNELIGDLLGTDVKKDPISIVKARLSSLLRSFCKTGTDDSTALRC